MINRTTIYLQKRGWRLCRPSFFVLIAVANAMLQACETQQAAKPQVYEGPLREAVNMEMVYSKKEHVTVMIQAAKVLEFQNNDRSFPEGIYIEFYDDQGNVSSTLSANTAYFTKSSQQWKGQGKVEVKNIQKKEELATEELFWYPGTKKITTDKFVTIRSATEVIYGTGLDAKQDMSEYRINKVEGEFAIEQ